MATDDDRPLLGSERIGRYVVLKRLGSGGMGVVYSAVDEVLRRRVAVKLLFADRAQSEHTRRRLEREAQVLARLSHPNVVQVYEVGEQDGCMFMAMELVAGTTLKAWSTARPRRWREVLACYLQAARGLQAAHDAGVLHRDFKPDNVILGDDGRVRVVDFGLARSAHDEVEPVVVESSRIVTETRFDERLTKTGAVIGTPAYMAPEQFLGRSVDVRADVFSFCVSLYEALYHRRPHQGRTRYALFNALMSGPKQPPSSSRVPARIGRIIMQGLASDPGDRPASIQSLIDALELDPRRKQRQWVMGGILSAVAGIAAFTGSMFGPEPSACEGYEQMLARAWDQPRRERIEAAFESSGSPFAATTWPAVAQQLDRQAGALVDGLEAACAAGQVTPAAAEARYQQRMACLDDRIVAMRALTDWLEQADEQTVAHAEDAASKLPDPGLCAKPALLDATLPLPRNEAQAQLVAEVRKRLAQGQAWLDTGHPHQAQPLAAEAWRRAAEIGYVPLAIEADLFAAEVDIRFGHYESARDTLLELVDQAEANRHDAVLAKAWLLLVHLGVDRLGDSGHVEGWIHRAESNALRAGSSPGWQLELASLHALWAVRHGHADTAQVEIERGLRLREALTKDSTSTLGFNLDMARAQLALNQGRPEEAATLLEHGLSSPRANEPEDYPRIALLHYNLGSALWGLGRLSQAREHYEHASRLWGQHPDGPHWRQGLALMGLGNVARTLGDTRAARADLDQAIALLEAHGGSQRPKVGEALSARGTVALDEGDLLASAADLERSLAIFEQAHGDGHTETSLAALNLAEVLLHLGRVDRAALLLERGEATLTRALGPNHPVHALSLKLRGLLLLLEGRPDEAITPLSRALELCPDHWAQERSDIVIALAVALWHRDPAQARRLAERPEARVEGSLAPRRHAVVSKTLQRYDRALSELGLDPSNLPNTHTDRRTTR